jgi:hypothetical protein
MTYNFDPEAWFDRERAAVEHRQRMGRLDDDEAAAAITDLERRYEEMVDRLDGTFVLPD